MRLCRCSHVAFARRARAVCVRGFHHSLPTFADLGPGLGLGRLALFFPASCNGERYPKTPLIALVGDSGGIIAFYGSWVRWES